MEAETGHIIASPTPEAAVRRACAFCNAPLPSTPVDFCPLCGHAVRAGLASAVGTQPAVRPEPGVLQHALPSERTPLKAILIGAAVLGAVSIGVLFIAANAGGDSAATSAPTAFSQKVNRTPATRLAAAPSETSTATEPPTPRASATPTPVLPTPVVTGFPLLAVPTASPSREIIDAVNRSAAAYSAATSRLDESLLDSVFTGEALLYYTAKIHDLRASNTHSTPALGEVQLISLFPGENDARVMTRERWRMRTTTGCSLEGYDVTYGLSHQGNAWFVSQVGFQLASTTTCP